MALQNSWGDQQHGKFYSASRMSGACLNRTTATHADNRRVRP